MNKKALKDAALGGIVSNPVFVLVLGTCPTLQKSDTLMNAFGLGVATAFVLIFSNLVISLLRKVIPDKVRLPAYIVVIATFVTIVECVMGSVPALQGLNKSIGAFIPLIVVNCIILGRAEAFAGKNGVLESVVDGVSMGLGFIVAISLMGGIRQLLTMAGFSVFGNVIGGFIIFGSLMALFNAVIYYIKQAKARKLLGGAKL